MIGFDRTGQGGGVATPSSRPAFRMVALCAVSLLAAGCATLTPDECLHADWRAIGHEDGAAGRGVERLAHHRSACAKVAVTPDFAAYQAGHAAGARVFCHPANGYRVGRNGYVYTGICPADLEPEFLAALEEGLFVHQLELDVDAVANEIARVDYEMDEIVEDIENTEDALERDGLADGERRELRDRARRLSRDLGRLEATRGALVEELREREHQLRTHLGGG